jgi:two-component system response regulator RegX3
MPEVDGLTVCREIRADSKVPIIMLTGMEDESDAAAALEMGADDYIRKPFGTNELLARVRAILRRSGNEVLPDSGILSAGEVTVDVSEHTVQCRGVEVSLTRTEFNLLVYLLSNQNRVLTHDQILEKVWGPDYVGSHHVLRVCISRMRQKFGDANALAIEALSGVGYRLRRSA